MFQANSEEFRKPVILQRAESRPGRWTRRTDGLPAALPVFRQGYSKRQSERPDRSTTSGMVSDTTELLAARTTNTAAADVHCAVDYRWLQLRRRYIGVGYQLATISR
jgi:hypothetical protein